MKDSLDWRIHAKEQTREGKRGFLFSGINGLMKEKLCCDGLLLLPCLALAADKLNGFGLGQLISTLVAEKGSRPVGVNGMCIDHTF